MRVRAVVMNNHSFRIAFIAAIALLGGPFALSETWRIQPEEKMQAVSEKQQYLQAVTEIKQLVNEGKTRQIRQKTAKLKDLFPELATDEFDDFIQAELLLSKAKFKNAYNQYEKFLNSYPQSRFCRAALQREYQIGNAYLSGQKRPVLRVFKIKGYAQGKEIMQNIAERTGDDPIAQKAMLGIAESYRQRKLYEQQYLVLSEIYSYWPTGAIGKNTLLNMARCKHAAYKGPRFDDSNLRSAGTYYRRFTQQYPETTGQHKIDEKLTQIKEQLAYKKYKIAQYYQRTGNKQAANLYFRMVAEKFPRTTAGKLANQAMTEPTEEKKVNLWKKTIRKLQNKLL